MTILEAIVQGIIQGLTEFLPVSSSGHVSLAQHFMGVELEGAQAFTLFLHFGTLIAVFVVYRKLIWDLIKEFFSMVADFCLDIKDLVQKGKGKFEARLSFNLDKMNDNRRMVVTVVVASACAILLFIPLFGGLGLVDSSGEAVKSLADISTYTSEDPDIIVEGNCLLITGALLLIATYMSNKRKTTGETARNYVDYKSAVAMGVGQCFAALPGLSRSGTTTTMGMITGTEKNAALQFSFIMSIPAVLAANALELIKMDEQAWAEFEFAPVLVGVIFAMVFGILAIAGLKWIVSNDKLHYFGFYCLAAGALVIILGIAEKAMGVSGTEVIPAIFGANKA